ncbi:GNAT family N-acetyltransferase [Microbacterium thalassium]|uniref:Ribosomal protein S18 acetylase RimI-like enzyme n=1 Tax=Microbacterium thalassium TaxID=362649 RepID=A0A7X0FS55_9MICO|nr:GNAT family N-acetyltransferase [Microbacterium thalassium]MBB6392720.1 ribosomal protein S18 acetylase RimI-like enzyme [Microbacterium thalassium]GLK23048.1 hypothetical protein GCM10017607_03660 [Microbacterium thalassium]
MIVLEPIPRDRFAAWRERAMAGYRDDLAASGRTADEIEAHIARVEPELFTDHGPREGHFVFEVSVDDDEAGYLWVGPGPSGDEFYVWDVEIDEAWRGMGLGRSTMLAAEELARAEGYTTIALAVGDANTVARGLYDSLGYETVDAQGGRRLMRKAVPASGSASDSAG